MHSLRRPPHRAPRHPTYLRSLLAALDVHPRIAMAILRRSRIALTMEVYTQVPDKATTDALRRLRDWLDHDEDQGDEVRS